MEAKGEVGPEREDLGTIVPLHHQPSWKVSKEKDAFLIGLTKLTLMKQRQGDSGGRSNGGNSNSNSNSAGGSNTNVDGAMMNNNNNNNNMYMPNNMQQHATTCNNNNRIICNRSCNNLNNNNQTQTNINIKPFMHMGNMKIYRGSYTSFFHLERNLKVLGLKFNLWGGLIWCVRIIFFVTLLRYIAFFVTFQTLGNKIYCIDCSWGIHRKDHVL